MAYIGVKPQEQNENYPNSLVVDREKLIFVRFDGINPSSTSQPVYFPTDDVLKNKVITGIDIYTVGETDFDIQTDLGFLGTALQNGNLKYFTITLVGKNSEILIQDMPLACLAQEFGKVRRFSMMIDLSKSYVRNFAFASVGEKTVIPILFYYRDKTI